MQHDVLPFPDMKKGNEKSNFPEEITERDEQNYLKVISTKLSEQQTKWVLEPPEVYTRQETVTALHWHPEFIDMNLIRKRIDATFPNKKRELIIPTQHNVLMDYDGYSGVEVDCHSPQFNQKVQLLLHFKKSKVKNATVLKEMLRHTLKYRGSQLFGIIDTITLDCHREKLEEAVRITGAGERLIKFVKVYTAKVRDLMQQYESVTPEISIKNKLIANFFENLRDEYDDLLINRAQNFIKTVKGIVKREFSLDYFYRTEEIIEEARSHNGGIVVPHPEQFWPILLADYDVDGYEAWNPQSQKYTDFLIGAVQKQNAHRKGRPLLIFMGDDTHMGEKVKDPNKRKAEKYSREIGVQPPWDDLGVKKTLIMGKASREKIIDEYSARLS